MRRLGRPRWNFPPFTPSRLREEQIRSVTVSLYKGTNWTVTISINVTESLRNEFFELHWLNNRLRLGFERKRGLTRFHLRGGSAEESTVTLRCAYRDGMLALLREGIPIVLEAGWPEDGCEGPSVQVRLTGYTLSVSGPSEVKPSPRPPRRL